jgi:hypothetical protein
VTLAAAAGLTVIVKQIVEANVVQALSTFPIYILTKDPYSTKTYS